MEQYHFPFGQSVKVLKQQDCSQKDVFILGVYASTVHARWVGPDSKIKIAAVAVASEPYIFWRGEHADEIINQIDIPAQIGRLEAASEQYNGPSGRALDDFLEPLGITREETWLCDLIPYSCQNPGQRKALEREYFSLANRLDLEPVTVPRVPAKLTNEIRRNEIANEIETSKPNVIILLGDKPIRWFLRYFDNRWTKLSDFGEHKEMYGRIHRVQIRSKSYNILPLAHPRQTAKLGSHSPKWNSLHRTWFSNPIRL